MSTHKFVDYYCDEMIYKQYDKDDKTAELDDIYEMIYKPNENKEEKKRKQIN